MSESLDSDPNMVNSSKGTRLTDQTPAPNAGACQCWTSPSYTLQNQHFFPRRSLERKPNKEDTNRSSSKTKHDIVKSRTTWYFPLGQRHQQPIPFQCPRGDLFIQNVFKFHPRIADYFGFFSFFLLSTHTRKLDWFSKLVDYCANFLDGSRSVSLTPFFPPFSSSNWSCRSISVGLLSGLSLLSAMELRNLLDQRFLFVSFFLISFWFFTTRRHLKFV